KAFIALGVRPREHVGLLMTTQPEFVEAMFGAALAGAAAVPINARYAPRELSYLIENADITTLVTTDKVADAVDCVARLNEAFPDIAKNRNALSLSVPAAPKLRNIVITGLGGRPGYVPESDLPDLAGKTRDEELDARIADV